MKWNKRSPSVALVATIVLAFTINLSVCAADKMTEQTVVALIRDASIVKAEQPVRAIIDGDQLTVQTSRTVKATDKACKIDAVFIAKTVQDKFPNQLKKIKVLFARDLDDKFNRVIINPTLIEEYGAGKITEQHLLDSLQLAFIEPQDVGKEDAQPISVLPGPFRERRLMLLERIEKLKKRGTGVKPFENLFNNIETLIGQNKTDDANTAIDRLADRLSEQENFRRQAEIVQRYKPSVLAASHVELGSEQSPALKAGQGAASASNSPHRDTRGRQRMQQIEQKVISRSTQEQEELRSRLRTIPEMMLSERLWDAERTLREIETKLGLSKDFENMLPEGPPVSSQTQGQGQRQQGSQSSSTGSQGWGQGNSSSGFGNSGGGGNGMNGGPPGGGPDGGSPGGFGPGMGDRSRQ